MRHQSSLQALSDCFLPIVRGKITTPFKQCYNPYAIMKIFTRYLWIKIKGAGAAEIALGDVERVGKFEEANFGLGV